VYGLEIQSRLFHLLETRDDALSCSRHTCAAPSEPKGNGPRRAEASHVMPAARRDVEALPRTKDAFVPDGVRELGEATHIGRLDVDRTHLTKDEHEVIEVIRGNQR